MCPALEPRTGAEEISGLALDDVEILLFRNLGAPQGGQLQQLAFGHLRDFCGVVLRAPDAFLGRSDLTLVLLGLEGGRRVLQALLCGRELLLGYKKTIN